MKNFNLLLVSLFLLIGVSCKKFVEVGPPTTMLTDQTVYKNNQTATSALTSIYSQLAYEQSFPFQLSLITGLYSDELTTYCTYEDCTQSYLNALRPYDAPSYSIWTVSYSLIYQCNGVYEGCANSSTLSEPVKKQLMAEAKFLRAYLFFNLVNLFGDVPLTTSTDYKVNGVLGRTAVAVVYQQIIDDLIYAQNNLNQNYVDILSTGTSTERVRANQAAATSLLARVYLYLSRYPDAEQQAGKVISNKSIYDTVPLDQVFLKNNKEAIWQLSPPTPTGGLNTFEGASYVIQSVPQTGIEQSSVISKSLYDLFEPNDHRRSVWIGTAIDNSVSPAAEYKYPAKYKVVNSAVPVEYSTVIRLGELYLIRAEVRAQQGNLDGAINDLDVIRERAGLNSLKVSNPGLTKEALLKLVSEERQRELFTEYGHRWMDLKRTGKADEVMSLVAPRKGGTWSNYKQLWPIPQTDIQNNPAIQQNPGYN